MYCQVCGVVDEYYDENSEIQHDATPKHICNLILLNYKENKRVFTKNRDGVIILCNAESQEAQDNIVTNIKKSDQSKIRICVKPNQEVKFSFDITNDMKNEDILVVGVHLAHPQPLFTMNDHPYKFGEDVHNLEKKTSIENQIHIMFKASEVGQYEMPIMFTFHKKTINKNLIIIREMVVFVQESAYIHNSIRSPYTNESWPRADHFIPSTCHIPYQINYKIPKLLKIIFPLGLEEKALDKLPQMQLSREVIDQMRQLLLSTRDVVEAGPTKNNYMMYFHHLLWWEECIARINLKKYNMSKVNVEKRGDVYVLLVPGLAEKRPSLLRGDRVFLRPIQETKDAPTVIFESKIKEIEDSYIHLANLDESFSRYYSTEALFDVRFLLSRVPFERSHEAVSRLYSSKQDCRVFPEPVKNPIKVKPISKFYNPQIAKNEEQISAVEHIVSGTSGKAPYIIQGPPGTGKTMTIVEAIIQLVVRNPKNRVLVCTHSNMAADHIAVMLMQYNKMLNINNFLLRANSQSREWSVMPASLAAVSNGTTYENFYSVSNERASSYRILITTLLHAAKYASNRSQAGHKLYISHLFIDEAAQADEAVALIPITGLLAPTGKVVLAGDPEQLGPVCISRDAAQYGLDQSLLQRLLITYKNIYCESNYFTMLVKNFRSHPDILYIPNVFFYDNKLEAFAAPDPLSEVSILGLPGGNKAVIFHAVHAKEQRMGKSPSYFNEKELEMVKKYIRALVDQHQVSPKDIGVIAPYIRQVYKVKGWLTSVNYTDIEVGTVESFQGKEKRVIIVTTVRANCRLLDYDAKYSLGFLVDDKRYNVTLTRAKAKIIIIGNPTCLVRDRKWRKYMDFCKDNDCYYGTETQQLERTSTLLTEVAKTRFDRCRLSEELNSTKKK